MAKVLVADDDSYIRELVGHFLRAEGYEVMEASNGLEAINLLETHTADAAVIDVMMPVMDGWELCETLKSSWDMPVLMLTAKGETAQKLKGFQLGTDDYMVKPFEPLELAARVKALLKRYRIASSQTIQAGRLQMNRRTFQVTAAGEELTLPLKEFELLFKLASYPGQSFSRGQLIEEIWGMDYEGNERTLDVHINRLREKFPEDKLGFRIYTIRGLGYRLEVTE